MRLRRIERDDMQNLKIRNRILENSPTGTGAEELKEHVI